jgi:hypothetical protein
VIDITKRFIVEIYAVFPASPSASLTINFRNANIPHLHTTLAANPAVGATGATGATGTTGATGATGLSISYALGNSVYAPSVSLLTTTVGTAQTAIYQVGPITTTATTKLMVMATSSYTSNKHGVQLTVGRATTSGATAAASTNIVSNAALVLPAATTAYYMAAWPAMNDGSNPVNLNGFALDSPGAGTFYYTIWMSSSASHNYTTMAAALTVLKVQM